MARTHQKGFGDASQYAPSVFPNKVLHLEDLVVGLQNIDFIDDKNDFLAPGADVLKKEFFTFRERAICGGDEKHQVGTRHEL
jgi:hypothetical protein